MITIGEELDLHFLGNEILLVFQNVVQDFEHANNLLLISDLGGGNIF